MGQEPGRTSVLTAHMLQLFVNDLSLHRDQCAKEDAIQRLRAFCSVLQVAYRLDDVVLLNSAVPVAQLQFGDGWPLSILRNDRECIEENRYIKRLQDRAPFDIAMADFGGGHDIEYLLRNDAPILPGAAALGVGLSHHANGLSISFGSHAFWREREIDLVRRRLDGGGEIVEDNVTAVNAASTEDVEYYSDRFEQPISVASGIELWERRGDLFPFLRFIPRTRAQMEALMHGDPQLNAVVRKLQGLNDAVGIWDEKGGDHPRFPFKARPESGTRIDRGLVSFNDGVRGIRIFSWHCDFTPGEGRIHFILESEPARIALIGHVGSKLGVGIG